MRKRKIILFLCLVAGLLSCQVERSSDDESSISQFPETLPLIHSARLAPIVGKRLFQDVEHRLYTYYRRVYDSDPIPYIFTNDAVGKAKAFLRDHYGQLKNALYVHDILKSASGHPIATSSRDKGHTIVFITKYKNVPLMGCGAIVFLRGKEIERAEVGLRESVPLPGSERRIVTRDQAFLIWNQYVMRLPKQKRPMTEEAKLLYVRADTEEGSAGFLLRPQWSFNLQSGVWVDALNGALSGHQE